MSIQFRALLSDTMSQLSAQGGGRYTPESSAFTPVSIEVLNVDEAPSLGDVVTPRYVLVKLLEGDDLLIGFNGTDYPFRLTIPTGSVGESVLLRFDVEGIREISTVQAVADVAASLAGLYFDLEDRVDTVRVWLNIPAKAKQTLTLTGNAENNNTVVLGATTYTFKTTLTVSPTANEVLIGATASDSLDNLIAAITAGAGSGTLYGTGTTANASATAAAGAGDTMIATALTAGTAGNSIASTQTLAAGTWGAATLAGGTAASTPPATPSGGRLVQVTTVQGAANTVVAAAIQAALDADAEFSATVLSDLVTITDRHTGARTTIAAGTSTFTVDSIQTGVASPITHLKSLGTSQVLFAAAPY